MISQLVFIGAFFGMFIVLYIVDRKYSLGWFEYHGADFSLGLESKELKALKQENKSLKKRVETLEAIVTDPAYELKREFKQL